MLVVPLFISADANTVGAVPATDDDDDAYGSWVCVLVVLML